MGTMEAHVEQMDAQLKQWAVKIDERVAKAGELGAEAKEQFNRQVEELKAKHKETEKKLDHLKAAGAAEWETFKAGVESAWNDFETSFKKLTA